MAENNGRPTWVELTRIVVLIGAALGVGYKLNDLTTEIRLLRSDICQYSVPPDRRQFAYSCQRVQSGLQAQEPLLWGPHETVR